ncbi:MAG: polyhydroxyalkanoic acid system family protein [Bacteroidota bacterium]
MAHFDMSIPHQLSKEDALIRIKNLLSETKKQHGDKISNLQEEWRDNIGAFSFTVMGFDVSGILTVNEDTIGLDADLPFAASLFKGKIRDIISEKAGELLRP